jgi:hypothetical protein
MPIVFIDGADHYLRQDKKWKNAVNSGSTISGISGMHSRANDDDGQFFRRVIFPATTRAAFRQRFIFRANSASNNDFIGVQSSDSNTHLTVRRNNDGTLSVARSGGGFTHTTTATYALDTPFEIEFRAFISNGVGQYLLKVDGEVPARSGGGIMWGTGLDTQNGGEAFITAFFAGSDALNTYADDAVVATGNHNLGLGEVETLYPTGPGAIAGLLRGGTDTLVNFSQSNETLYDSATTYVTSTGDNQRDCYAFGVPIVEGDKYIIAVTATCQHGGSGDPTFRFRLFLHIDGDNYDGLTIHDAALTYECFQEVWNTNPATGVAWQLGDFPVEAGILCIDNDVQMTQLVMEVAALTPTPDPVIAGAARDYCGFINEDLN